MSKRWNSPPTDVEVEDMITPVSEPLDKGIIERVFLGLVKLPKNAHEHWVTVMGTAVEIARHIQKL